MLKKVVHVATTELWFEISHILGRQYAYPVPLQGLIFSKILVRTRLKILQSSNSKVHEVKIKTSQRLELGSSLLSDGHLVNWHSCGMHCHVTLAQGIPSHAAPARGDREGLENRPLIKNYEGLLPFLSQTNLLGDKGTMHDVTDFPTNDPTTYKSFVCLGSRRKGWSQNGIADWGSNPIQNVTVPSYRDWIVPFSTLVAIGSVNI